MRLFNYELETRGITLEGARWSEDAVEVVGFLMAEWTQRGGPGEVTRLVVTEADDDQLKEATVESDATETEGPPEGAEDVPEKVKK